MGALSDEVRLTAPGFSMIAELFPVPSARARLTATCTKNRRRTDWPCNMCEVMCVQANRSVFRPAPFLCIWLWDGHELVVTATRGRSTTMGYRLSAAFARDPATELARAAGKQVGAAVMPQKMEHGLEDEG